MRALEYTGTMISVACFLARVALGSGNALVGVHALTSAELVVLAYLGISSVERRASRAKSRRILRLKIDSH